MIGIIDYDSGNIRSVQNALDRVGAAYILTDQRSQLDQCDKIIFPGVGSAASSMQALHDKNLVSWIQSCTMPFLGICLGMQLLFEYSAEGNTQCLNVLSGETQKFKATKKVPHMGWNQITSDNLEKLDRAYCYFVHSYFVPITEYTIATSQYQDETFSSIVKKDNFLGMQFHPEKSGFVGQQLLMKFVTNE